MWLRPRSFPDRELLRQAALLLEHENARLFGRLESLAAELREARGFCWGFQSQRGPMKVTPGGHGGRLHFVERVLTLGAIRFGLPVLRLGFGKRPACLVDGLVFVLASVDPW